MIRVLITNWWLLVIRGCLALIFAIFVFFFQPFMATLFLNAVALTGLTVVFGLFAAVCGLITILAAVRGAQRKRGLGILLADGVAVTVGGLIVLLTPGLTLVAVVRIIAATALILGILEIAAGLHLRRHLTDEWLLIAGGVASLIFAAYLLVVRPSDVSTVLSWTGIYAFASGGAMVGLALRLRSLRHSVHVLADHGAAAHHPDDSSAAVSGRHV